MSDRTTAARIPGQNIGSRRRTRDQSAGAAALHRSATAAVIEETGPGCCSNTGTCSGVAKAP